MMQLQKDNIPVTIRKLHPKMSSKKYEENLKDDDFLEKNILVCYTLYCDVWTSTNWHVPIQKTTCNSRGKPWWSIAAVFRSGKSKTTPFPEKKST